MTDYSHEHVEWLNDSEAIITIHKRPWFKTKIVRYRGSSTIWHELDTGKRATTFWEIHLSEIWTKAKWLEEDFAAEAKK